MDEIELLRLQDEALSYLRDNITKDEAYYILTTENEMTEVLMSKRKDGSKRIKILDAEYTIEKDDTYNRGWSKGDYTMLYYAFPDSPNIGYLSHGEYGMSVAYSRAYIPSCGSGSGCCVKEEATFDLEAALDVLNGPLPRWCRSYGVYPKQYDNIDKWYNSDNHNKKLFKEI